MINDSEQQHCASFSFFVFSPRVCLSHRDWEINLSSWCVFSKYFFCLFVRWCTFLFICFMTTTKKENQLCPEPIKNTFCSSVCSEKHIQNITASHVAKAKAKQNNKKWGKSVTFCFLFSNPKLKENNSWAQKTNYGSSLFFCSVHFSFAFFSSYQNQHTRKLWHVVSYDHILYGRAFRSDRFFCLMCDVIKHRHKIRTIL